MIKILRKSREKNEGFLFRGLYISVGPDAVNDKQTFMNEGESTVTRDEFEYMLIRYEKDIYSICIRLTGNRCEADELFQDTCLSAMEHMEEIDFRRNPRSYLIGKASLLWRAKRRKIARRQRIAPQIDTTEQLEEVFFVSGQDSPEQMVENQELVDTLRTEVARLKEKYRIVIELYYAMDLTSPEIAHILKIPQGTVESRLYKARNILKRRMEELGYEIG